MSFNNKVVLITGAGSGIGKATTVLFAKEGAHVVIVDCNEMSANATAEKCEGFGKRIIVIKADVSKADEVQKIVERTIAHFGNLDVVVNAAGIVRQATILSGTILNTFDEVIDTNLRSVIAMTSCASPHLIKSKGCIVNISSVVASAPRHGVEYTLYTVSKAGVDCFTRLSAMELAPHGVRVNVVEAGPVHTNLLVNAGINANFNDIGNVTALKRSSDPEEIADIIIYLASNKARSITGSAYKIDNGIALV